MNPQVLARIERINYVLTVAVALLGVVVLGRPYAIGVATGALVASLNFTVIRARVDR